MAKVPVEERTPYIVVAIQECERMNLLSSELRRSLKELDLEARATFMYKIVNNVVDVHAEHILTPSDNRTRGNAAYRTLYTNADVYRYSACHFCTVKSK
jgi:hypothetical protein